jgi:homoserine O-succinyltransferase
MPVIVETNSSALNGSHGDSPRAELRVSDNGTAPGAQSDSVVTVGLVNNMGEGAFRDTEQQFVDLLNAAAGDIPVRLALYVLPSMPGAAEKKSIGGHRYLSTETLGMTRLDGLIVTGREPSTPSLRDEPYWQSFTAVLDWARDNTHSAVWSCLAAHAAVLHMDGIGRRKSLVKNFGLFECERDANHWLTYGLRPRYTIPHSRWNGVPREDLVAAGYEILAQTANSGVDTFVKKDKSVFVFFQGHPEYETDTLMREYRRDVGRFLRHEMENYPNMPLGYFSPATEELLNVLREEAILKRDREMLTRVAGALESAEIENTWKPTAAHLYRNWLHALRANKDANRKGAGADVIVPALR